MARYMAGATHPSPEVAKCLRHRSLPQSQREPVFPPGTSANGQRENAWLRSLLLRLATDLDELALDAEPKLQHELSHRAAVIRRHMAEGPLATRQVPRATD